LSRVNEPSLNERRAPVNAPPIAAFFCFIKKAKKSPISASYMLGASN
jgi:hypothetical protein